MDTKLNRTGEQIHKKSWTNSSLSLLNQESCFRIRVTLDGYGVFQWLITSTCILVRCKKGPGEFWEVMVRVAASGLHQSINAASHSLTKATDIRCFSTQGGGDLKKDRNRHRKQAHSLLKKYGVSKWPHHSETNPSAVVGTDALG